jgi:hypothetical protein
LDLVIRAARLARNVNALSAALLGLEHGSADLVSEPLLRFDANQDSRCDLAPACVVAILMQVSHRALVSTLHTLKD